MTGPELPGEATGVITIDLDVVAANWQALARLVAPTRCAAVVKANAYGLGADRVIPTLAAAGCKTFFVATPQEAAAARKLTQAARIFVLDGLLRGTGPALLAADAVPVLSSLSEIDEWAALASERGRPLPAALQIDTGLNRLGLSEADIARLAGNADLLAALDLHLVMSHLASADDPADPMSEAQRLTFERRRAALPAAPASLAASDGLMLGAAFHYDLVRPGYALYGGQAFKGGATPVKPAMRIETRVLQIRDVPIGGTVGYSATWTAARPTRLAIVAGGYADGLPRALSRATGAPGGHVLVAGLRAPVVGRVSMDLITVDVTDVEAHVTRGDLVAFVAPGLTIEDMGLASGTIGYEVLTRLGPRFARRYIGGA
jgi:alanine racemase